MRSLTAALCMTGRQFGSVLELCIGWFPILTRAYGRYGRRPRQKLVLAYYSSRFFIHRLTIHISLYTATIRHRSELDIYVDEDNIDDNGPNVRRTYTCIRVVVVHD